jgi:hypothetical protein
VLRLRLADAAALQLSDGAEGEDEQQQQQQQQGEGCAADDRSNSSVSSCSLTFDRAAAEVVAALQACAEEAQAAEEAKPPLPLPRSYLSSWQVRAMHAQRSSHSSGENEAAAVLQLGVQALKLGIQGAAALLLQQLQLVCNAKQGLAD